MRSQFSHDGTTYNLSHLSGFIVTVEPKSADYAPIKLRVTFSHHVFTKGWVDGCDPLLTITENGEIRTFCFDRYNKSTTLIEVVKYHIKGRAYADRDSKGNRNHLFYQQKDGEPVPYAAYFNLTRSNRNDDVDGTLHIISAYEKPTLPPRKKMQAVTFRNLVEKMIGFKPMKGK